MQLTPTDTGIDLLYGIKGPTHRQVQFRDCPARYKLYGGAVGGGKSVAVAAESLRLSLAFNGNRGFLCRHESRAFVNTTLKTLLKLVAEIESVTKQRLLSNHHKTDKMLYFTNGSEILYGGLGEASDFERIKSLEIGFFGIDEASETVLDNFRMLKSRLRWKLPSGTYPPFTGLLASNPEPGWVKNLFVTPEKMGKPLPRHSFIQALPTDNPYLPSDYIPDLKESNPESWVSKYIKGNWDALAGQIWPMFDFNDHVIEPFSIPQEWRKFRAIDHGQVNPTACLWFAIDYDGNIYVYREYYSPGLVSDHCKAIKSLSENEDYTCTKLPPESWGRTMEKDHKFWSVADEYREHGLYCSKANNEVEAGINRVGEFLTIRPDKIHPLTATLGSPTLFIFKNCVNLILEIPDYIWKNRSSEDTSKEQPKKMNDHACDALRYGIMTRPNPAKIAAKTPFNSFLALRERMLTATAISKRTGQNRREVFGLINRGML